MYLPCLEKHIVDIPIDETHNLPAIMEPPNYSWQTSQLWTPSTLFSCCQHSRYWWYQLQAIVLQERHRLHKQESNLSSEGVAQMAFQTLHQKLSWSRVDAWPPLCMTWPRWSPTSTTHIAKKACHYSFLLSTIMSSLQPLQTEVAAYRCQDLLVCESKGGHSQSQGRQIWDWRHGVHQPVQRSFPWLTYGRFWLWGSQAESS